MSENDDSGSSEGQPELETSGEHDSIQDVINNNEKTEITCYLFEVRQTVRT